MTTRPTPKKYGDPSPQKSSNDKQKTDPGNPSAYEIKKPIRKEGDTDTNHKSPTKNESRNGSEYSDPENNSNEDNISEDNTNEEERSSLVSPQKTPRSSILRENGINMWMHNRRYDSL